MYHSHWTLRQVMAGGALKKEHQIFSVGSSVEVLAEDEDYGGVLFTATVIEPPPSFNKRTSKDDQLYVEYRHLLFEEGGSKPLREYVDLSLVRPQPPTSQELVECCFEVGKVVDAFYDDGWWTGVVTRLVEGEGPTRRVIVTFHHPPDVRELGASDLRPHLKWVDGTWITPEKQDVPVHSCDGVHLHDHHDVLSLMNDLPEESASDIQKTSNDEKSDEETLLARLRRQRMIKSQKIYPQVHDHPKASGENTNMKNCDGELLQEDKLEINQQPFASAKEAAFDIQKTSHVANSATERRNSPEPQASSMSLRKLKEGDVSGARQQFKINRTIPEILSGLRTEDRSSDKLSQWKFGKKCSNILAAQTVSREINYVSENSEKMMQPLNIEDVIGENSQNGDINSKSADKDVYVLEKVVIVIDDDDDDDDDDDEVSPKQEKMELDSDIFSNDVSGHKSRQSSERSPAERHDESFDEETILETLRRQKPIQSQKISPQVHDNPTASGERINEKNCDAEAERVVIGAPGGEFHNGPLLECMKEMLSPPVDPIGSLNLENSKDKCMENEKALSNCELLQEDKLENCQQPSGSTNEASFELRDEPGLPFVKDSDLWKTIEAMEAFKKIPQKPHFRPLEKFAERSRQGYAIGLMVNCASVMEEALNLRLSDPKSITDSILEMLTELETHGFDVRVVKDRINDFIAMKDKQHDYLESVKKLDYKILERDGKRRRNIEELDGEASEESQLLTLSDLEHLGMDKVTSASDTVSLPNSQLPSSNNTNIESEMASVMDSLYTQPHVYLRTCSFEKMVQAVSLAAGLWTVEIVEQTLRDLGVNLKPTVPTKEVCAEHLELRKEILTLLNLQKQLEYKEAET